MAGATTTGRRLGRYHLGDPLGGGPCGSVYKAKVYGVAGFERQFAVKRFHPELVAIPVVPQRLSAAARAYGSLEHPRIARLHEYGVAGGEVFTATEMVAGLDVMRLIAATHGSGQPLPPGAALALATQAARAIGYAHGRGLAHLGICPTNVVVTPEGDVKITDFGMLAQTLTVRPSDDPRLVHRIHHLAPEQLVGEAASSASDVFALGALIHELVTGERAFVGVTPLDVEHAILSGHVREAGLPKAMGRVLARCFARSPYERFPDARALADSIDAALRVTPVTGGRRELGGIVKDAVARLDAMNEGQLSGAMMLAMPMPPPSMNPATVRVGGAVPAIKPRVSTGRGTDQVTSIREPFAPPAAAAAVVVVPPVPPRPVVAAGAAAGSPSAGGLRRTPSPTRPPPIMPPAVVPGRIRSTQAPPMPVVRSDDDSEERTIQRDPMAPQMSPAMGNIPPPPSRLPNASPMPFAASPDDEGAAASPRAPVLRLDSAWPTDIPDGAEPLVGRPSEPLIEMVLEDDSEGVPVLPPPTAFAPAYTPAHTPDDRSGEVLATPLRFNAPAPEPLAAPVSAAPKKKRSAAVWTVFFLFVCSGLGVGAVLAWDRWLREDGGAAEAQTAKVAGKDPAKDGVEDPVKDPVKDDGKVVKPAGKPDAGTAKAAAPDAGTAKAVAPDAGTVKAVEPDAGTGTGTGTGTAIVEVDRDPPASGDLLIESKPKGATVYVDGADEGETPVKLAGSDDRHTIAVVMAGFDLYTAETDGRGKQSIVLVEVTPLNGPAGIKVKCKAKHRYYIFVDGHPTGQLCPTERIGVELGDHVIEVYDLVTETRRQIPARVKETRNSLRVKLDF